DLPSCSRRLSGFGIYQHQVTDVYGCLLLFNTSLGRVCCRFNMFGNHIKTFDKCPSFLEIYRKYRSSLTLVITCDYLDSISSLDMQFWLFIKFSFHNYNTSGANDMIFINCFSLNSRATGPKIRVPLGSLLLFKRTAALSSKRI